MIPECPNCGSEELKYYMNVGSPMIFECLDCGHHWIDCKQLKESKDMNGEEKKINWDKPLRVKATGYPARVLCRDFKAIFGLRYVVAATNSHGKEDTFYCKENDNRVENILEKQEAWINIHEKVFGRVTQSTHPTKAVADAMAGEFRTARIKIEWEEGQFDE